MIKSILVAVLATVLVMQNIGILPRSETTFMETLIATLMYDEPESHEIIENMDNQRGGEEW